MHSIPIFIQTPKALLFPDFYALFHGKIVEHEKKVLLLQKGLSHKGKFLWTVYILEFTLNMYYALLITRALLLHSVHVFVNREYCSQNLCKYIYVFHKKIKFGWTRINPYKLIKVKEGCVEYIKYIRICCYMIDPSDIHHNERS